MIDYEQQFLDEAVIRLAAALVMACPTLDAWQVSLRAYGTADALVLERRKRLMNENKTEDITGERE